MNSLQNIDQLISAPGLLSFLSSDWSHSYLAFPLIDHLAFVLLHFIWQGLAIGITLHCTLKLFQPKKSTTRYTLSCLAMFAMIIAPALTFFMLPESIGFGSGLSENSAITSEGNELTESSLLSTDNLLDISAEEYQSNSNWYYLISYSRYLFKPYHHSGPVLSFVEFYGNHIHSLIPILWLIGMILLAIKNLDGIKSARQLSYNKEEIPQKWIDVSHSISQKLSLRITPKIYLSNDAPTAVAVGLFKPVVLFPASWLLSMPAQYIEAIIAHEISHIKRWDLWMISIQRLMETILFYHPIVWWLSHKLHLEREMCCDESASSIIGNRINYAETLQHVARMYKGNNENPLYVASFHEKEMDLTKRIKNLLEIPSCHDTDNLTTNWKPILLIMLAFCFNYGIRSAASVFPHVQNQSNNSSLASNLLIPVSVIPANPLSSIPPELKNMTKQETAVNTDHHRNKINHSNKTDIDISQSAFSSIADVKPKGAPVNHTKNNLEFPNSNETSYRPLIKKQKNSPDSMAKFKMMTVPMEALKKKDWPIKNAFYMKVPVDLISLKNNAETSHAHSLLNNSTADELLPDIINRIVHSSGVSVLQEGTMDLPEELYNSSHSMLTGDVTSWFLNYIHGNRFLFKFKISHLSGNRTKSWNIETQLLKGDHHAPETTNYQLNENEGILQIFPLPEHDIAILVYTQHPAYLKKSSIMK